MLAIDFVESKEEQAKKRYADKGKSAAVALRHTEPWHDKCPCIVVAGTWFGGMATSSALMMQGLFSITNAKQQTTNFCKKELWADARCERCTHQRDDRAFR
jgi:hypothetical protein